MSPGPSFVLLGTVLTAQILWPIKSHCNCKRIVKTTNHPLHAPWDTLEGCACTPEDSCGRPASDESYFESILLRRLLLLRRTCVKRLQKHDNSILHCIYAYTTQIHLFPIHNSSIYHSFQGLWLKYNVKLRWRQALCKFVAGFGVAEKNTFKLNTIKIAGVSLTTHVSIWTIGLGMYFICHCTYTPLRPQLALRLGQGRKRN